MVYDDFDAASHGFGLVATAALYQRLTGDRRYDRFATAQRDWVLGANPWGVSLVIGVGSRFARCPQHVVANLAGGRDGKRPFLLGAVVNGPNDASLFSDGLGEFFEEGHTCPSKGGDRYTAVQRSRQPLRRRRALVADGRARDRLHGDRGARLRADGVGMAL